MWKRWPKGLLRCKYGFISFSGTPKRGPFWKQIQGGLKTTTLRDFRKDGRPHVILNATTELYWRIRTKKTEKPIHHIGTAKVTRYEETKLIDLWFDEEAAKKDGFEDINEFRSWFLTANQLPEWNELPGAFKRMIENGRDGNFDKHYIFKYDRHVGRKQFEKVLKVLTTPMALIGFKVIKDENESNVRDNE